MFCHSNVRPTLYFFIFIVVETETTIKKASKYKRSVQETPDDITAGIAVDGVIVDLHLRKNTEITDNVPVLLQRNGKITPHRFPQKEVKQENRVRLINPLTLQSFFFLPNPIYLLLIISCQGCVFITRL